jgi:hypothetical protein
MRVLVTAVKAVVAHAVAIAIARLLMEDDWNLCREFIGVGLIWVLRVGSPELIFGKNWG